MTREQAINSMISHGFTVEQAGEIIKAVTPQLSSELEKNSKKLEKGTTKNDLGVDCISRQELLDEINNYRQIERKQLNEIIKNMPSVTPQLSVPEVTALAEWTTKLTKASEDAYNKGYADGMKEQEPILDKIRAELVRLTRNRIMSVDCKVGLKAAINILDEYKAEQEGNINE